MIMSNAKSTRRSDSKKKNRRALRAAIIKTLGSALSSDDEHNLKKGPFSVFPEAILGDASLCDVVEDKRLHLVSAGRA